MMTKRNALLLGFLLLGVVAAAIVLSMLLMDRTSSTPPEHESIAFYTCGMHPSVHVTPEEYATGTVTCPICNMKLVPVAKQPTAEKAAPGEKAVNFYTCGMHPSVHVSPEEYAKGNVNCPICNMKLVPVYRQAEQPSGEKKVLFYRDPSDPTKTSMTPKANKAGQDFTPVYEETGVNASYFGCGMEGAEHVFSIKGIEGMSCPICGMQLKKLSPSEAETLQGVAGKVTLQGEEAKRAGVLAVPITRHELAKTIRTVGRIAYDPKLATAEEEYLAALTALSKMTGGAKEVSVRARKLVDAAERKLILLGLSEQQIKDLKHTRQIHENLILPEEKMWVYGDIYEFEQGWVKVGQKVQVTTQALPGKTFEGVIASINPVLDPKTRSLRFRAEVENPNLGLKPEMYVDVLIESDYTGPKGEKQVLAIPKNAVLDTGTRKIAWVETGDGTYEGRVVQVGPEASAGPGKEDSLYYPVLSGLGEGERVVTKANFLIDSQSQLSGVAASAYGGALGAEDKKAGGEEGMKMQGMPGHHH